MADSKETKSWPKTELKANSVASSRFQRASLEPTLIREEGELSSGEENKVGPVENAKSTQFRHEGSSFVSDKNFQTISGNDTCIINSSISKIAAKYKRGPHVKRGNRKISNNRNFSWSMKPSDDNLVISFSDDESESDYGKPEQVKCVVEGMQKNLVNNDKTVPQVVKNVSKVSAPWKQEQIKAIEEGRHKNAIKPPKGGLQQRVSPPLIARMPVPVSKRKSTILDRKGLPVERCVSVINMLPSQEDGASGVDTFEVHLENLRHKIALQENKLKFCRKPVTCEADSNVDLYTYQPGLNMESSGPQVANGSKTTTSTISESECCDRPTKRYKAEQKYFFYQSSENKPQGPSNHSIDEGSKGSPETSENMENKDMNIHFPDVEETLAKKSYQTKNGSNETIYHIPSPCKDHPSLAEHCLIMGSNEFVASTGENSTITSKVDDHSGFPSGYIIMPYKSDVNNFVSSDHASASNLDSHVIPSSVHAKKHHKSKCDSIVPSSHTGVPSKGDGSNIISPHHAAHDGKALLDGTASLLTPSAEVSNNDVLDNSLQGKSCLGALLELEELQYRELVEAQDNRRKCEIAEQHALKAYRNAQIALIEANERCAMLHRQRGITSARVHRLMMEKSSSLLSSYRQNEQDAMLICVEGASEPRCERPTVDANGVLGDSHRMENLTDNSVVQFPLETPLQQVDTNTNNLCHVHATRISDPEAISSHSKLSVEGMGNFFVNSTNSESEKAKHAENHVNDAPNISMRKVEPCVDNSPLDYGLLESSLRSKLVERYGIKFPSKRNVEDCHDSRASDGENVPSVLKVGDMYEKEGRDTSVCEGALALEKDQNCATQCEDTSLPLHENCYMVRQVDDASSPEGSCLPYLATCNLPPVILLTVSRHAKSILLASMGVTSREHLSDNVNCKGTVDGSNVGLNPQLYTFQKGDDIDGVIDPSWPFCMFELRGKCNDEECQWQHFKNCTGRSEKSKTCADTPTSGKFSCLSHCLLPIPLYYIGQNLIKADTCLSQTAISHSTWKYWQLGFCASFPVPFSVQRIIASDSPFLQPGDPSFAYYDWNEQFSLFQDQGGTMRKLTNGPLDSERNLELALEIFLGKVSTSDRKKALSLLSSAIEIDPSSVYLWIIYLHIYYQKEKIIGKEDLFYHAVQCNAFSYELWLLYIRSRFQLNDCLNAYTDALIMICCMETTSEKERTDKSTFLLDIYLQMMNFLCMSGNADNAISRICGLISSSSDCPDNKLLTKILSCLEIADKCIFWLCCIYLIVYRELPRAILEQLEFEKEPPFGILWPSVELSSKAKILVMELLDYVVDKMAVDLSEYNRKEELALMESLHCLAVNHISCVAIVEDHQSAANLLVKYLELYPTSIALVILAFRFCSNKEHKDIINSEEVLCNWPSGTPGIQCVWNQYAENALANKNTDFAKALMIRWFETYGKSREFHSMSSECKGSSLSLPSQSLATFVDNDCFFDSRDDIFWFLNLSLYKMLENNLTEALLAADQALKLSHCKYYKHCLREQATLRLLKDSLLCKETQTQSILDSLRIYLSDFKTCPTRELLSRRCFKNIKRCRVNKLIDETLGPLSADCSFLNCILEVCFGPSLLPEKFDGCEELVDFVEWMMEAGPANYCLALAVCRFVLAYFSENEVGHEGTRFWASSILVNSLFRAVPVALETVWLEAADVLRKLQVFEVTKRFYQQALCVYPFSMELWQSYFKVAKISSFADEVAGAARERGVEDFLFLAEQS